jgi:type I restriction enzyme, R subunit
MYVDKKLGGVNAVQTLSRLNRIHPPMKKGTLVLDFANEADEIKAAFEPYYETTLLSEATDPNLLYEIQSRLAGFPVHTPADVDRFARIYFDRKATQDQLYQALAPVVERARALPEAEQPDFRGHLTDYVRLYAFLAQVLTFADADLEKLYVFARHLRRLLPADREELPREVQQNIDMESYRIQQTGSGRIALERKVGLLDPVSTKSDPRPQAEELEALSRIIAELTERFGLNLGPEHRLTLGQMMSGSTRTRSSTRARGSTRGRTCA